MLKKVKDFSKVKLNSEDVLVLNKLVKKGLAIELPDDASQELREQAGNVYKLEILAVGSGVDVFKTGEIVVFKTDRIMEFPLDPTDKDSDGISVTHMNNIMFTVTEDNYELS